MIGHRPTWLVTGGSGFLGRLLLDRLEAEPVEVVAIGRRALARPGFLSADLLDRDALERALDRIAPSVVFHLAGRTPPADAEALDRDNRQATLGLVESLRRIGRPVRLVATGSAAELGPVPIARLPVCEDYPPHPDGDYGRTKLAGTLAILSSPPPIEPVVARVFNPIGRGMPTSQALGRFAAALAEGDGPSTLTVGDLSPRRDFIDARDVAEALVALGRRGQAGLYHVGSGRSWSVREGLDELIRLSGRSVRIVESPGRPSGPADSRAEIGKIGAETGWSPRVSFARSLADLWAASSGRG